MANTKTNVWSYRETLRDLPSTKNLVGYDVEASDGHIGKVDGASDETSHDYLVVDTGFWIFGKKRMIPAGVVTEVDHTDQRLYLSMTKDQVKSAPDFDDAKESFDEADYEPHGSYYRDYGW
jgi:hypothetical protein